MIESFSPFARRLVVSLVVLSSTPALTACDHAPVVPQAQPIDVGHASTVEQSDSALRFPLVPDPAQTPGAVLEVTAADLCVSGYSKRVRNRRVCSGTIELEKAQQIIAHDWVIGYRIYVNPYPPTPKPRARRRQRQRYAPRQQPNLETAVP